MPFSSYAELQASVVSWLNRPTLSAVVPDFIALGESRIRRDQRLDIRVHSIENGGQGFTWTSQGQALPVRVRDVDTLWLFGESARPLDSIDAAAWRELDAVAGGLTDAPRKYALLPSPDPLVRGPRLFLHPAPTDSSVVLDFQYVRDIGRLQDGGVGHTALLVAHPDLYLYAALVESAPFLKNDERIQVWEARYQEALMSANRMIARASYGRQLFMPLPVIYE